MAKQKGDLEVNDFAAPPFAFGTCPPDKCGQHVPVAFAFAFGFTRMRFDALGGIDGARNQDIGAKVAKAFPFIGGNFAQIVQCGFLFAETAPVGFGCFAVAFADEDNGCVRRLFQQGKEGAGQPHRGDGVDTVLVDPFGDGLEIQGR